MVTVTLDTCLLISLLDRKDGFQNTIKLLEWHKDKKIEASVSNRLFEPDIVGMDKDQQEDLINILSKYAIVVKGNTLRLDISTLGGKDLLSGPISLRSEDEMSKFKGIVGDDPSSLPSENVGRRLPNKIGDYDSLFEHFCNKRDIFITSDKKDYFHTNKRKDYSAKLGLIIKSPLEFISEYQRDDT
jgi:hypothetical protein